MRTPTHVPQPAVARLITNRIAVPGSAARRRRRRRRSRLALALGPNVLILLLLWPGTIWAEELAQNLPPVHVEAAASSDSVEARVDLGDPSTFPFSSTGKWTGYLEFLGKPGTARTLGQPDLFLPLLQDVNDLTFFNLRGQLQFDNTDVHEYNIGLGHRHMFQEWILGGYGYYDQRHTQFGSAYSQFTGGLEAMSVDWAARLNGYLPENKMETIMSGANVSVIRPGDQIKVQIGNIVQERALPGVDGEVGYLLPLPYSDRYETRVYAGGYHFFGEDQFESVTGPRGRLEMRMYDLPVLGPGSRFMMGVEAQWDEPRGSQAFGLASLRIPFDVFADKSTRKALKGLDRRMLQPVIRDVDVVTSQRNITEVVPALNPAGKAYTKAIDVTLDELESAIADHPDEVIAIFVDGKDNAGNKIESVDRSTDDRFVLPTNNQTVSIRGKDLKVGYRSQRLGTGTAVYSTEGTPFTVWESSCGVSAIVMKHGSHLNGLTLDAIGCNDGITFGGESARYDLTNATILSNAKWAGLLAYGEATVYISDSEFIGPRSEDPEYIDPNIYNNTHIDLFGNTKAYITNTIFRDSGAYAIRADGNSTATINDSQFYNNARHGITLMGNATGIFTKLKIYGNVLSGLTLQKDSIATVKESEIYNNGQRNILQLSNSHVTLINSRVYGAGWNGIWLQQMASIDIYDSQVSGNGLSGLHFQDYAGGTVWNTHFYENKHYGIYMSGNGTLNLFDSQIYNNELWGLRHHGSAGIEVQEAQFENNGSGAYCVSGVGWIKLNGEDVSLPRC